MATLLLALLYVAFVSLGLPDSLTGSAWPVMHQDLGVALSSAGVITMIISFGTVVSSLLSDRLTAKFGTGAVTAVSTLLTALALFGFSVSNAFWQLCIIALPYGLGAGAIDAALNNYVALHYSSRHMSWLHGFWGLGALISPYIMGACLTGSLGWRGGYRTVSIIQTVLTAILFVSLPFWRKTTQKLEEKDKRVEKALGLKRVLKLKGVVWLLVAFFCYCAAEATAMLWASSYLVRNRGISEETAATFGSLFYIGMTAGRMLCGFVTEKLGDKKLIRIGAAGMLLGIALLALPVQTDVFALAGFVVIGFGCAPVYPSIIHQTPTSFGEENSQAIIGIQMASAYFGSTLAPPIFGLIAEVASTRLLPLYMAVFATLCFIMLELLWRRKNKRSV
ncbi:MAG: MFS transporter [Clostridia bacterium]|nr:MFS transporter [Clostridia bacterium]